MIKSFVRVGSQVGLTFTACLAFGGLAFAQALYTSGASDYGSSIVSSGQDITANTVSDSFILPSTDTITGVGVVIWTYNADPPYPAEELSTVDYQITTSPIAAPVSHPLSQGNVVVQDGSILNPDAQTYFQVEQDSFQIQPLTLDPGTYYLSLFDANTVSTDPADPETTNDSALWDELLASDQDQPKAAVNGSPDTASTFIINGEPAVTGTPEPSSLLTLTFAAICLVALTTYRMFWHKINR